MPPNLNLAKQRFLHKICLNKKKTLGQDILNQRRDKILMKKHGLIRQCSALFFSCFLLRNRSTKIKS